MGLHFSKNFFFLLMLLSLSNIASFFVINSSLAAKSIIPAIYSPWLTIPLICTHFLYRSISFSMQLTAPSPFWLFMLINYLLLPTAGISSSISLFFSNSDIFSSVILFFLLFFYVPTDPFFPILVLTKGLQSFNISNSRLLTKLLLSLFYAKK